MYDEDVQKPPFSAEEIRILGCLLEKHLTTPNNYPLTLNALMQACNQKSSREPIMNLNEGKVGHLAKTLVEDGWAIIQNSERAQRVEHKVSRRLNLNPKQQAVLAVLLLRRPQTLNEIKTRTERMADFSSTDEIQGILDAWISAENPLAIRLPAGSGRREDRYFHTLGEEKLEDLQEEPISHPATPPASTNRQQDCCAQLEARIAELEQRLSALENLLR
ncbi:DUF480 domain-containing protein [Candidatus Thiothrix sp. Deng01]|uniref:DUF480 domain-containing protein n=1 Tax=Candidatus Thiothrix phosphatis TaxID=3112415 RepID=A0ABU6CV72_9GAMM|nr:DUF480 domain-containing protein [Candidatus Thiothrix sp. Deng01]MEB4590288.1 DUF480 domain-containing protein [Candidatus Thiothrix sp. Deng01]